MQPHIREFVDRAVTFTTCPECGGTRLAQAALSSLIDGKSIADLCRMQITELAEWVRTRDLPSDEVVVRRAGRFAAGAAEASSCEDSAGSLAPSAPVCSAGAALFLAGDLRVLLAGDVVGSVASAIGAWSAASLSSRTAWTNNSDFSQDMGVATMNTNLGGWHIVDYFGGQGFTVNKGKSGVYEYAFGYPAESPFDGGNLYRCQGSTSPEWDAWIFWSQTVKIPCDMTRGSSGGGWLNGYDGNWGYLNGVNSRIDKIVGPTIMLSPYFDDDAWSLYNYTRYN